MAIVQRMSIHDKILELREKLKMSQDELEKITGLSQASISNIENGKVKPRKNTLKKIAKAFGITLDELLAETTTTIKKNGALLPSGRVDEPNFYLTQDEIYLITVVRMIGQNNLAKSLAMAGIKMPDILIKVAAPFDDIELPQDLERKLARR